MTVLRIATLFPLATVAAGDEANATALARRAEARGVAVTTATVNSPESMVDADVYLLGGTDRCGTEDLVGHIQRVDLAGRIRAGATVLAVDAGMDALARRCVASDGSLRSGAGLLDVDVLPAAAPVTDTVVTCPVAGLGLPAMLGWVSHASRTVRSPGIAPLAAVERGLDHPGHEPDGAVTPAIIATRLHGPVLALNPELADLVLARALPGLADAPLPPAALHAREVRVQEVRSAPPPRPKSRRRWLRR